MKKIIAASIAALMCLLATSCSKQNEPATAITVKQQFSFQMNDIQNAD
jgi:hypothetical protein